MATTKGPRVKELAAGFQPIHGVAIDFEIVTPAAQRAKKAAADIEQSPTAPRLNRAIKSDTEQLAVPARPSSQRNRKDSEPTPPASPQDGLNQNRGRGVGMNIQTSHSQDRAGTPEPFSDISIEGLRRELGGVKAEIASLHERLTRRDDEIHALGRRLDDMKDRYDEAIINLKRSQAERDELKDQVERLRGELREERSLRREMENELEEKQRKARKLNEVLVTMSDEAAERARKSALDAEDEMARIAARNVESRGKDVKEKRTSKKSIQLITDERPQSSVTSIFPSSKSSKSFKGRKEISSSSKPRWKS
ncbi:hypothetical protein DL95DRAFT_480107 [Leptodontidium sp. 2 PMI_412]|nr:hypothetical protein DL95DRAFT_480107 [Leptodontidium sp. 2 PMI_412]